MGTAYAIYYRLVYPIARLILPCHFYCRENIPDGPLIVCANHTSLLDPVLVAMAFGRKRQLFFMAKAELFEVPLFGRILKSVGVFPINREETDISSIRTAIKHLKNNEQIMMFPEGTRVGDSDSVSAKSGAVRIATKMKAAILPVFLTKGKKLFHFSQLVIGKPYTVQTPPDKDYTPLADELLKKIRELEPKK
ncbi:MAG: 1-acyl-sn-glycerol-3-phosphate acyltransferase [Oscillospiraceae bacterium]|nr:1-acyl-sn-glycerol-3-phosphate acyltransferase [Oscillospiraceae bacterium]